MLINDHVTSCLNRKQVAVHFLSFAITVSLPSNPQRLQEVAAPNQETVWHITPCKTTICIFSTLQIKQFSD